VNDQELHQNEYSDQYEEQVAEKSQTASKFANNWQRNKIKLARTYQEKVNAINNLVVQKREEKKLTLTDGRVLTDFASCSYLGLDQDSQVIEAGKQIDDFGVNFSASRKHVRIEPLDTLENLLSEIFCGASATVFTSVHLTHLGFIPLLASGEMPSYPIKENGPLFIVDKRAYPCLQINRGLMLQFGHIINVNFENEKEIEMAFQTASRQNMTPISVSDSVISMGGISPIHLLFDLADKYEGYVYLDDAEGTSVYGKNGCGYALDALNNVFHPRMILVGSLSKGFGANGGVLVLPTKADGEMVKDFAMPYLFSSPPCTSIINSAIASAKVHLSGEIVTLQNNLWDNVDYFDSLNRCPTLPATDNVAMRSIVVGNENKAIEYAEKLQKAGFLVTVGIYPAMAIGEALLRVSITANHHQQEIAELCKYINKYVESTHHKIEQAILHAAFSLLHIKKNSLDR